MKTVLLTLGAISTTNALLACCSGLKRASSDGLPPIPSIWAELVGLRPITPGVYRARHELYTAIEGTIKPIPFDYAFPSVGLATEASIDCLRVARDD